MTPTETDSESRGFVFAATGEIYITLARRAARSLRAIHPKAEIDLFTDTPLEDAVFDKVHILEHSWFRPKMEALRMSRFDRTVFLDADIMVVADIASAFDVLDRFDFAIAQDRYLNNLYSVLIHRRDLPNAFPVLNSGVMAVRKNEATRAFLDLWEREMIDTGAKRDQPVLRELLYDSDLRYATLPPGYNFLTFHELRTWFDVFGAPRVLHAADLHRRDSQGDPETPFTVEELIGKGYAKRLQILLDSDLDINPDGRQRSRMEAALDKPFIRKMRHAVSPLWHKIRYR